MPTLAARLAALEQKVHSLEDELAIHRLLTRHGIALDVFDNDLVAQTFTEDGVYDPGGLDIMEGRKGIREHLYRDLRANPPTVARGAHTMGPLSVQIDGDRAWAVGYARTYSLDGTGTRLSRFTFNRIELERRKGRWLITRRTNRAVGTAEALTLFREALQALG